MWCRIFKRADLHCHTNCSDGSLTPTELILKAKERALFGLSITDHDTIKAYPEAIVAAQQQGIALGSGVEFSCHYKKMPVHILGYDFLLDSRHIDILTTQHQTRRLLRNRAILEKLAQKGMKIEERELVEAHKGKSVGRPHIADLLVKKGYVSTIREAFHLYLGEGKSCYEMGVEFSLSEAIETIHRAEGKVFLAHPHLLASTVHTKAILDLPFDGIECHYALFSKESAAKWLKIAEERKLLISGGSDFHGEAKPQIELGCSFVGQEQFDLIFHEPLVK